MVSSQLISTIDNELRRRESELALAKVQLQRGLGDSTLFSFSYRCFVAMTYAHFEAYTKRVIAQAMQDMFTAGRPWSDYLPTIRSNLFSSGLRQFVAKSSNEELAALGGSGANLINAVPTPSLDIILDCGNMNVTNFYWAIASIGLDSSRFSFARRDVGRLTSLRHDCAHGEALTFDPTKTREDLAREMFALQTRVLLIMHTLAVEILDHFKTKSYLAR